jgi:hypothetical protein
MQLESATQHTLSLLLSTIDRFVENTELSKISSRNGGFRKTTWSAEVIGEQRNRKPWRLLPLELADGMEIALIETEKRR